MIPFLIIAAIILLFKIKYVYYSWMEYVHCIQLVGLTYYSIYPYSVSLQLYSFLMGANYANFSFIYNVPLQHISPCLDCSSYLGFAFTQGDMNFLRGIGSVLELLGVFGFLLVILLNIKCSYKYGIKLLELIISLTVIKILHSWIAAFVYAILNKNLYEQDVDYFIIGSYCISFFLISAIVYQQYKWKREH